MVNLKLDGNHEISVITDENDGIDQFEIAEKLFLEVKKRFGVKETPSEQTPTCGIHHVSMVWKEGGVSKTTGRPYPSFWACPERMANGSYCNFRAPQGS